MMNEYEKCFSKVNIFLKLIGLSPNIHDDQRNMINRLRHRPLFVLHMISLNLVILGQLQWLRNAFKTGKSFLEITYCLPCFTLCLLCDFVTISTLNYAQHTNELLKKLKLLQIELMPIEKEKRDIVSKLVSKNTSKVLSIMSKMVYFIIIGDTLFAMGPLIAMYMHYTETGEILHLLPLYMSYPFDITDMKFYLLEFAHQIFTGAQTLFLVFGPSCLFFFSGTFIHIHFLILQYDIENLINEEQQNQDIGSIKLKIEKLIERHVVLLRCVELLEIIYSKSILYNTFTSSTLICVTGFNILANENVITSAFFTSFLMLSLFQIFFFCYYGDNIAESSSQVSDAIYNSRWYLIEVKDRRILLIMLIRAQKPCTITAYGFFDINLTAFTKILSKSWSYFALLKTLYQPE